MIRFVLWIWQGVLLALFVAAYAARYVHPRDAWWLQGIAVVMPVLIAFMTLTALGFAWVRQPVGVAIYLVLLLALAPRYLAWPSSPGNGPVLQALSLNAADTYLHSSDSRAFQRTLQRHAPGIVALQEAQVIWFSDPEGGVVGAAAPSHLLPLLHHPELKGPPPDTTVDRREFSLPLFTTLPWRSLEEFDFGAEADTENGPRSTLSRAVLEWEGQLIAVYNVHLRSFGSERPWRGDRRDLLSVRAWRRALRDYRSDFVARAGDAEQLRTLLDAEPYPFLLCGDFNSTPHHWTYSHLARGLRDTFRLAGRGWGGTYHDRLPLVRIDYIMTSQEWEVRSAQVLRGITSDHRPVLAAVSLRQEGPGLPDDSPAKETTDL